MSMKNKNLKLIYCYDAYCGWCYGFSKVIQQIAESYKDVFEIEVLSGGMILDESYRSIGAMAKYIQSAYKQVEEFTGVKFGEGFLHHIFHPEESTLKLHSEKSSIALLILKEYHPEKAVAMAAAIQQLFNVEGLDLTEEESYQKVLAKYSIPTDEFYRKLHSNTYRENAYYEFQLVKQLRVTSFPQVLLQVDDSKFYLAAKGYTDYATLNATLNSILKEIKNT